jgi:hypothetical protein
MNTNYSWLPFFSLYIAEKKAGFPIYPTYSKFRQRFSLIQKSPRQWLITFGANCLYISIVSHLFWEDTIYLNTGRIAFPLHEINLIAIITLGNRLLWEFEKTIDLVLIDQISVGRRSHLLIDTVNAKKRMTTIYWGVNKFLKESHIVTRFAKERASFLKINEINDI